MFWEEAETYMNVDCSFSFLAFSLVAYSSNLEYFNLSYSASPSERMIFSVISSVRL